MDYEKLHKDTITKLQEMINSGKITAEIARDICADFVPESESEEDSCYYDDICEILINLINNPKSNVNKDAVQKDLDWFISLKNRIQFQQEWSEEDEKEVAVLEAYIRSKDWSERHIDRALGIVDGLVNKVKSIKPHNNITDEELAQAKKDAYNDVLNKIEYHSDNPTFDDGWSAAIWYFKKRNVMLGSSGDQVKIR